MENDRRFAVSKDNALANTIHSDWPASGSLLREGVVGGGDWLPLRFGTGLCLFSFFFLFFGSHATPCRVPLEAATCQGKPRALSELGGNANLALLTAQWVAINRPITDITCYRTVL